MEKELIELFNSVDGNKDKLMDKNNGEKHKYTSDID